MEFYVDLKKISCLLFILCLTACGGGGGGKSDTGANPPPPATSSSQVANSSQPVTSSSQSIASTSQPATSSSQSITSSSLSSSSVQTGALAGRIWHSFSDLDTPEGTFFMDPNTGVTTTVLGEEWGVPWLDGSRFVLTDYNPENGDQDTTRIVVRRTSDKAVLMDLGSDGYVATWCHHLWVIIKSKQPGEKLFSHRGLLLYGILLHKKYSTPPSKVT